MLKSSLLEILRTFSKQELIKFEDFVSSPYFNKKENVLKLFLEVKKYSPDFMSENLEKEKVWSKLFPDTKYNYGIMKNLIFDLNKLAELFIADLKYCKDENRYNEYLMNALLDRDLNRIYKIKFRSSDFKPDLKLIDANNLSIQEHFYHVNSVYQSNLFYYHQYEQNYDFGKLQIERDAFLMSGFLIQLFAAYSDVVAIHNGRNTDFSKNAVTKFVGLISSGISDIIQSFRDSSEVTFAYPNIYYMLYLALTERTEQRYQEFKKSIYDILAILPKTNLQSLLHGLANAAIITKFENIDRDSEMLSILDTLIEHDALTELRNDKLPIHIFTVYISICFVRSDSNRLKKFSDRFIDKLDPDIKKNTTTHVNFMTSFIDKSYDDALNYISMLDIPYFHLKPAIRYHKAICLYETNNYESFLNEYDSLKHFLNNNNFVAEEQKLALSSKFSIIKRLFNLRQHFHKHELSELRKLHRERNDTLKWLEEKLEEFEKNQIAK
jgi:hypothetical protein